MGESRVELGRDGYDRGVGSGELPDIFDTFVPVLDQYGYMAVAVFVFLEGFGVPMPGETILIAGAVLAGAGHLNAIVLGIVTVAAAAAGDSIGFAMGHFGGRPLLLKWGKYVFITQDRLTKAEKWFERHGGKIITVARFIEGFRQVNGIIAGISTMRWRKFVGANLLGAGLWCALWVSVGYIAGDRIGMIYQIFRDYVIYIGLALAVLVLACVARRIYHHRKPGRVG